MSDKIIPIVYEALLKMCDTKKRNIINDIGVTVLISIELVKFLAKIGVSILECLKEKSPYMF